MIDPISKYRAMSFEQKLITKTVIGLGFSLALAIGKFVIGFFSDYNLISIAVYTFGLLLAKFECVLGVKTSKKTFEQRNFLTALFLLLSGIFYILFMGSMFFTERKIKNNRAMYVLILAFISFCELGFAIAGLLRTRNRGHYFRNIKIINFCIALIAILTTQMSILNMQSETGVADIFNAYTGIAVGCFTAICAIYILIAPKISVVGRERNTYVLKEKSINGFDMQSGRLELLLCRSMVYGDYVYRAKIENDTVDGYIGRNKSLWKRLPVPARIICCILSEILIFLWLAGRGILFLRSENLPRRLDGIMKQNGFEKIPTALPVSGMDN